MSPVTGGPDYIMSRFFLYGCSDRQPSCVENWAVEFLTTRNRFFIPASRVRELRERSATISGAPRSISGIEKSTVKVRQGIRTRRCAGAQRHDYRRSTQLLKPIVHQCAVGHRDASDCDRKSMLVSAYNVPRAHRSRKMSELAGCARNLKK